MIGRLTDLRGESFTKVQLIFFKGLKSKASNKKESSIPVVIEFNPLHPNAHAQIEHVATR